MSDRARGILSGRGFVLLPAAAFAVHQLRYELAYGSRSGAALAAQGHGYQNSLAPWVVLLLALGLGTFLARFARAAAGRSVGDRRSFAMVFAIAWALLLSMYSLQEWLEGVFVAGHPSGLAGVFGHGGWWAVPLSAAAALVVAALLRLAAAVLEVAAQLAPRRRASAPQLRLPRRPAPLLARRSPLARRSAGRAPPALRAL